MVIKRCDLCLVRGFLDDGCKRAAYLRLLRDVLGLATSPIEGRGVTWTPHSFFDADGRCVANVDVAVLTLVVEGRSFGAGAVRSVAVDSGWRGHGLFRDLMREALDWCEARSVELTLLFTETPALYDRFGFGVVAQHAFVGATPASVPGVAARRLDISNEADRSLVRRLVLERAPVSSRCALLVDPSLVLTNLAKDGAPEIVHAAAIDALIAFETDDDDLVIADIVAPAMPSLADVLGALGLPSRRVKTLFPPDRLGWNAAPVREDTGLMIRGALPAGMARPFMLPPTVEF